MSARDAGVNLGSECEQVCEHTREEGKEISEQASMQVLKCRGNVFKCGQVCERA